MSLSQELINGTAPFYLQVKIRLKQKDVPFTRIYINHLHTFSRTVRHRTACVMAHSVAKRMQRVVSNILKPKPKNAEVHDALYK